MSNAQPAYDPSNATHRYIWEVVSHELSDEDFDAIQEILLNREDDLERIKNAQVVFTSFGEYNMYQTRVLPEDIRDGAIRYANWEAAVDLMLVLSKYCAIHSR